MGKYHDGQFISLRWEDEPDGLYVKGHVSLEEFRDAAWKYYGQDIQWYTINEVSHIYGRWSMETTEDGPSSMLRTYGEPGRGRFKITKSPYIYQYIKPEPIKTVPKEPLIKRSLIPVPMIEWREGF